MSAPAYESYKDSGVEWLGQVPSHWAVRPFKRAFRVVSEKATERSWALGLEHIEGWTGRLTESSADFEGDGTAFEPGDILYGKLRPYLAKVYVAPQNGEAVGDFHVLRSNDLSISSLFASYYLRSKETVSQLNSSTYGARMPRVSWDFMGMLPIPQPPAAEQTAIAAFLDRETGKIDALIEAQTRLIELLKEKRQAVISHAITKGLNPDAPMKDSGIEWLGQVPAHWGVATLRHLTTQIVDGAHFTPTYVEDGVPFLRVTDITRKEIDLQEVKRIPEHEHIDLIKRCNPKIGDLLLSKNGTIGVPKVVDWNWEFSIFVSLCLIKLNNKLSAKYVEKVFMSKGIEVQISADTKQSTVTNLHLEKIANFYFPVPPMEDQEKISSHIEKVTKKYDRLVTEAESAVSLLRERRAALISAAVTGKIDVRRLVNVESEAA